MANQKALKPEKISIKGHATLNEKWVQDQIAEDPSILGLGDVILWERERRQHNAGRLDILLEDQEMEPKRRYEVEIQLGPLDDSHIIRTLEYWDIERKRYPQYSHCAVIVAEEITSRFLNVISLFNGAIPLIAIQMSALQWKEDIALVFTTVLPERTLGPDEGTDPPPQPSDRAYWEDKSSKQTVLLAEDVLSIVKSFAPEFAINFTKFYISFAVNGQANNFVVLEPKRGHLRCCVKLEDKTEIRDQIAKAGVELLRYDKYAGRYRLRLEKDDVAQNKEMLAGLLKAAYDESRPSM